MRFFAATKPSQNDSSADIIIPKDTDLPEPDVGKTIKMIEAGPPQLTDEECKVARTISKDIEGNSLKEPRQYGLQQLDFYTPYGTIKRKIGFSARTISKTRLGLPFEFLL